MIKVFKQLRPPLVTTTKEYRGYFSAKLKNTLCILVGAGGVGRVAYLPSRVLRKFSATHLSINYC